jgi:DNA (cytosine-5)-methyltransferase 1
LSETSSGAPSDAHVAPPFQEPTRAFEERDALRALSIFGNAAGTFDIRSVPVWAARRYLGRDAQCLEESQQRGLALLAARTCTEWTPNCTSCDLRSFCAKPAHGTLTPESVSFVDLFCGAGGLSLGLELHGLVPKLAVDHDEAALRTYIANRPCFPGGALRLADLTTFEPTDVPRVPLVVGGPPCQGFSNANKQRLADDPRNQLYKRFLELTAASGARVCVMENVPGMAKYAQAVFADMADIGLRARLFEIEASKLGYPQFRKRVFWVGLKGLGAEQSEQAFDGFGQRLNERRTSETFSLWDAIGDLPPLSAKTVRNATDAESEEWGFSVAKPLSCKTEYRELIQEGEYLGPLLNHRTKFNNARDIEIYSRLAPGEGSGAESIKDIMPYGSRAHIFKDKFYRLQMDRPSKTITAHMYYDCHMYIHPTQARGLTPREAARVQGFPDHYRFLGYPNEWYRQIGNAVSPLVAWHVGNALAGLFHDYPTLL